MVGSIKKITLTKRDQDVPVFQLVHGDRETSGLQIHISRYDSGVDLAELGWCINVASAAGDTDIIPVSFETTDSWIVIDWVFPAIAASAVGETVFEVEAVNADQDQVWQSGKRHISVIADLDAEPGYDPEELSIFQRTVDEVGRKVREIGTQVDGFEGRIETAVGEANEAAKQAREAAKGVDEVVDTAKAASEAAQQAVKDAQGAVSEANKAADDIKRRADAGEFNGRDGDNGKDWIPTAQELDGIAENAAGKLQPSITDLAREVDNKIEVSNTQPTADATEIWFDTSTDAETVTGEDIVVNSVDDRSIAKAISDIGLAVDLHSAELETQASDIVALEADAAQLKRDLAEKADRSEIPDISGKQDVITDLDDIREKANSALQEVPIATAASIGGVKVSGGQGLYLGSDGKLSVESAVNGTIDGRVNSYKPITPAWLNYAVKAALTDSQKMVLNNTEKASACDTIGATSQSMVSDAYSATKAYAVGDCCIYGNQLWRCVSTCTGVQPAAGANWEAVKVADALGSAWVHQVVQPTEDCIAVEVTIPADHNEVVYDFNFVESETSDRTTTQFLRVNTKYTNDQSYGLGAGLVSVANYCHSRKFRSGFKIEPFGATGSVGMISNEFQAYENPSKENFVSTNYFGFGLGSKAVAEFNQNHKLYFGFNYSYKLSQKTTIEVWSRKSY